MRKRSQRGAKGAREAEASQAWDSKDMVVRYGGQRYQIGTISPANRAWEKLSAI